MKAHIRAWLFLCISIFMVYALEARNKIDTTSGVSTNLPSGASSVALTPIEALELTLVSIPSESGVSSAQTISSETDPATGTSATEVESVKTEAISPVGSTESTTVVISEEQKQNTLVSLDATLGYSAQATEVSEVEPNVAFSSAEEQTESISYTLQNVLAADSCETQEIKLNDVSVADTVEGVDIYLKDTVCATSARTYNTSRFDILDPPELTRMWGIKWTAKSYETRGKNTDKLWESYMELWQKHIYNDPE